MFFDALAPSSALQLIRFSDVDAFRPAESMEEATGPVDSGDEAPMPVGDDPTTDAEEEPHDGRPA